MKSIFNDNEKALYSKCSNLKRNSAALSFDLIDIDIFMDLSRKIAIGLAIIAALAAIAGVTLALVNFKWVNMQSSLY